ncbi:hypothetical protein JTB14_009834 [Gonioctena quinquepunctata]|nr:hypothetical protein JTB14_009834 [Gonioctena quinquepunctata]
MDSFQTVTESWRHIAGTSNPADLPFQGCSPRQLYESKWWKGPTWSYNPSTSWSNGEMICDEDENSKERKNSTITTMPNYTSDNWQNGYFSKYNKIIQMVAWIFRFIHNLRNSNLVRKDPLNVPEIDDAKTFVIRLIQQECFTDGEDNRLNSLCPFRDKIGLIRLRSRISQRKDKKDFRFLVVLPSKHFVVNRLIFYTHVRMCHIGTEELLSNLREKYWILGGRRAIRSVIENCVICRR